MRRGLCVYRISVIKPQIPKWLFAAWKRVADDFQMVMRGWTMCGLRAAFEDKRKKYRGRHNSPCQTQTTTFTPSFPTETAQACHQKHWKVEQNQRLVRQVTQRRMQWLEM
jgi:hypothetical protein